MYNTLSQFFNTLDWASDAYMFSRPVLDNKPYKTVRNEKGDKTTIVYNALGVNKKDIKVEIIKESKVNYLSISGETKNEVLDRAYSTSGRFSIDVEAIDHVDWDAADGLVTVEVYWKQPEKSKIKINAK